MKAIAITQAAADGNNIPSLTEIDLPIPTAHGRDLLVAVKAISVNPVDTKVRAGFQGDTPRVLGWDAVGVSGMSVLPWWRLFLCHLACVSPLSSCTSRD